MSEVSARLGHGAGNRKRRGEKHLRTRIFERETLIQFFLTLILGEWGMYISNLTSQDSASNFCPIKLSLFYLGGDSFSAYAKYSKTPAFGTKYSNVD